jgi:type I restriction enzyme M protein
VIKPRYLWNNIVELARTQDQDLLTTLEKGFKYIENESFASTFQGLFSEINLNSEKLGKKYCDRNDKLCSIITEIAKGIATFSPDSDTLGDAYEYLIGQFAAGSGKKPGNFIHHSRYPRSFPKSLPSTARIPRPAKKRNLIMFWILRVGQGLCC